MSLTRGELVRRMIHIGCGGFALLLRFLTPAEAAGAALCAFLFNWQVLPRIGGRGMWRAGDASRGYPLGVLLYPTAVLVSILVFWNAPWMAAAIWGILALGDGMASLLGQALGGPRLPWNRQKGVFGSLSFVLFGGTAAAVLIAWTDRLPLHPLSWHVPRTLAIAFTLAIVCALVESMPTTLDDNLTVPLAGIVVLPLLAAADPLLLLSDPHLPTRLLVGLVLNLLVAAAALAARAIDRLGALSAIVIGTAITGALGLPGFAVMAAFFVLGSAATKIGYAKKAARGIAQERGGARGWQHAWANGGVPAFLAVMAGLAPAPLREMLVVAYAAAVATGAADTGSSEIGKAYGRRTFLITTLRPVPPGTEGAVSLEGTLGGAAAALAVAAVGWATGLLDGACVPLVAMAGLLGSLAESLLGTVAERRGWFDNNLLNALNTALGALFAVGLLLLQAGLRLPTPVALTSLR